MVFSWSISSSLSSSRSTATTIVATATTIGVILIIIVVAATATAAAAAVSQRRQKKTDASRTSLGNVRTFYTKFVFHNRYLDHHYHRHPISRMVTMITRRIMMIIFFFVKLQCQMEHEGKKLLSKHLKGIDRNLMKLTSQ
jgi:hypothetical protein